MRLLSSHASRPTAPTILTLCLVSLASAVSDQRLAELETLNALGHRGLSCGDMADKLAEACDQPIGSNGRRGICLCETSNKPRMIFPLSDNTPDCDLFTMASRIAAQGARHWSCGGCQGGDAIMHFRRDTQYTCRLRTVP